MSSQANPSPINDLLDFYHELIYRTMPKPGVLKARCVAALKLFEKYEHSLNLTWSDFIYDLSTHEGRLNHLRRSYENQMIDGRTLQDALDVPPETILSLDQIKEDLGHGMWPRGLRRDDLERLAPYLA